MRKGRKRQVQKIIVGLLLLFPLHVMAAEENNPEQAIARWVQEFQPSALTQEEQTAELKWFSEVSKTLRGMKIKSAAETINTHYWERDVLAKSFEEITGIHVEHDIIHEGEVIRRITEQMMTGRTICHIYIAFLCHLWNPSEIVKGFQTLQNILFHNSLRKAISMMRT